MNVRIETLSAQEVAHLLGGEVSGHNQVKAPGPGHKPGDRSLSIKLDPSAPDGFIVHSFAGDDPLVCKDYVREKLGIRWEKAQKKADPIKNMNARASKKSPAEPPTFPPRTPPDGKGKPRFDVAGDDGPPPRNEMRRHVYLQGGVPVRIKIKLTNGKWFNVYRVADVDGTTGWQYGKPKGFLNLPYFVVGTDPFNAEGQLHWPEGEKDVETLARFGLAAFTFGGVGDIPPGCEEYVRGRDVVIHADNHDEGRDHADKKLVAVRGVAASVKVVDYPDVPEKKDVSHWIDENGHTLDDLKARIEATPTWQSEPEISVVEMMDRVYAFLGRFVAYPSNNERVAHALWIVHAHLMDRWESTPRLAFLSPEPASGKSRALEVTECLVPRAIATVNVSPAYLFRKVADDAGTPTVLFDEIDTVFGPKAKDNEEVRGWLNAGHRRGATAGRCVVRGKTVETEELAAYCAVAVAGLGWLPDTILTRSVIIRMRRRLAGEKVEPFRHRIHSRQGSKIRMAIETWAARQPTEIEWPEMPDGVEDRDADVWESLLAVADLVGDKWPKLAREAAVALVAASKAQETSLGIRLLADIKTVFLAEKVDAMASKMLLQRLHEMPEAPWNDLKGKPLDERRLSTLLKKYEVKSKSVRIGDLTPKGYARADLHDAWGRYLATMPPAKSATSATSATSEQYQRQNVAERCGQAGNVADDVADVADDVADIGRKNLNTINGVADVADVADLAGYGGEECLHCHAEGATVTVSRAGIDARLHKNCIEAWEADFG
jgi:hypothetical protein